MKAMMKAMRKAILNWLDSDWWYIWMIISLALVAFGTRLSFGGFHPAYQVLGVASILAGGLIGIMIAANCHKYEDGYDEYKGEFNRMKLEQLTGRKGGEG